jgi:ketosteroid isomerase-like protein
MPTTGDDPRLKRVVDFFEQLREADLQRLAEVYAADARFKDPFNDVRGLQPIAAIFEHMFRTLRDPRFVVHHAMAQRDEGFLTWEMRFEPRRGGDAMCIRGATHLRFAPDGRVAEHRDYWDAAEELYEKLPLLGALMRWVKRRVTA